MNTLINTVFSNQEINGLNVDSISDSYLINQFYSESLYDHLVYTSTHKEEVSFLSGCHVITFYTMPCPKCDDV